MTFFWRLFVVLWAVCLPAQAAFAHAVAPSAGAAHAEGRAGRVAAVAVPANRIAVPCRASVAAGTSVARPPSKCAQAHAQVHGDHARCACCAGARPCCSLHGALAAACASSTHLAGASSLVILAVQRLDGITHQPLLRPPIA